MKKASFLLVLAILVIFACSCGNQNAPDTPVLQAESQVQEQDSPEQQEIDPESQHNNVEKQVISSTQIDIDKDGEMEELQIILIRGRFDEDKELWAGSGPKWIGAFGIQVVKDSNIMSTRSLNEIFDYTEQDDIFFYAPEFKVITDDYNNDGMIDFTLGQYFSSNGFDYYILSVSKEGIVSRLPIEGRTALFLSSRENTVRLNFDGSFIEASYYDNTEGMYFTDYYRWNDIVGMFRLIKRTPNAE